MSWQIKIIAALLFAAVCFGAGWRVKAAFVAERDLAVVEAKQEFIDAYRKEEGKSAALFEDKLKELKANEKTIEYERIKIVDRPVYRNECLDDDGLHLIEGARTGGADSGKSAR